MVVVECRHRDGSSGRSLVWLVVVECLVVWVGWSSVRVAGSGRPVLVAVTRRVGRRKQNGRGLLQGVRGPGTVSVVRLRPAVARYAVDPDPILRTSGPPGHAHTWTHRARHLVGDVVHRADGDSKPGSRQQSWAGLSRSGRVCAGGSPRAGGQPIGGASCRTHVVGESGRVTRGMTPSMRGLGQTRPSAPESAGLRRPVGRDCDPAVAPVELTRGVGTRLRSPDGRLDVGPVGRRRSSLVPGATGTPGLGGDGATLRAA